MRKHLIVLAAVIVVTGARAAAVGGRETGTLKVKTPGMVLHVKPDPEEKKTVPIPYGKEANLPPDTYKVGAVNLYAKDKRGQVWSLEAVKTLGKLKDVAIAAGETCAVEGGPPLKMKVFTHLTGGATPPAETGAPNRSRFVKPEPRKLVVMFSYVGSAGEYYSPKVSLGRRFAPRPVVRLTDERGRVLDQGKYAYPCVSGVG